MSRFIALVVIGALAGCTWRTLDSSGSASATGARLPDGGAYPPPGATDTPGATKSETTCPASVENPAPEAPAMTAAILVRVKNAGTTKRYLVDGAHNCAAVTIDGENGAVPLEMNTGLVCEGVDGGPHRVTDLAALDPGAEVVMRIPAAAARLVAACSECGEGRVSWFKKVVYERLPAGHYTLTLAYSATLPASCNESSSGVSCSAAGITGGRAFELSERCALDSVANGAFDLREAADAEVNIVLP